MIGRTLNHYRITSLIGRGGMGEVYAADDERLNRKVALKVLPPELAADPDRRARFEIEARAVAVLNHPNIVTIHSVEECDDVCFIAMELVEGKTLAELIPKGGFALERFFEIAIPLADALASAHQKGITHRDLKPANVMLSDEGRVKVLDFGLAKLAPADGGDAATAADATVAASITTQGSIVGTVAYMSPEQAEGKPVDARSDVFSMGIMLYEMATGERPFGGDTTVATITSIMRDTPAPVGQLNPSTPRHLNRVVDRCLAKDPDRRYQGALDVRHELDGLRTEVATDPSGVRLSGITPAAPAMRRKPIVAATLGVVALLALVALAIVLRPGGGAAPEPTPAGAAARTGPSVAVLPFANLSDDPANEYFSDGLAEELLNLLAKVRGLHVAARTSSFHFKGHTGNVADVASQLNVATILEGSVRRAGNRVRITAQLINAADGFPLWSDTYDRELDDVFAIQEEIATRVTEALKITLLGEDVTRLAKRPTENMEAYDAYLLGQQRMARRRSDSLEQATQYFERAIELDPGFAAAHANLAMTIILLTEYGTLTEEEAQARAEPLIERAIELDPDLGEAYSALGFLHQTRLDYPAAEEAYARAVALNPNHALTYMWYALIARGRDPEVAWQRLEKSLELDPMAPVANANWGFWSLQDNRPQEALERFRHVAEIDPEFPAAYEGMAQVQLRYLDQPDQGIESLRKAIELDPGNLSRRLNLGWTYHGIGRIDQALDAFREVVDLDPEFAPAYSALAKVEWGAGRLVEAIRWNRKARDRDPTDFDYHNFMADACLEFGEVEAAREWWDAAARANPDNPLVAFIGDWNLHLYHGELDKLEETIRRAEKSFPGVLDEPLTWLDLRKGRTAEARARTAKGFPELVDEADPQVHASNLDVVVNVAQVLLQTGDRERGELLLKRADEFLESLDEGEVLNEYTTQPIEIYAWQGRIDEAIDAARRAIDNGLRKGWLDPIDPAIDPIADDPRFVAMLAEMREDLERARKQLAAEGLLRP